MLGRCYANITYSFLVCICICGYLRDQVLANYFCFFTVLDLDFFTKHKHFPLNWRSKWIPMQYHQERKPLGCPIKVWVQKFTCLEKCVPSLEVGFPVPAKLGHFLSERSLAAAPSFCWAVNTMLPSPSLLHCCFCYLRVHFADFFFFSEPYHFSW